MRRFLFYSKLCQASKRQKCTCYWSRLWTFVIVQSFSRWHDARIPAELCWQLCRLLLVGNSVGGHGLEHWSCTHSKQIAFWNISHMVKLLQSKIQSPRPWCEWMWGCVAQDPTGCISGTIHRTALDAEPDICTNAVLILQKVRASMFLEAEFEFLFFLGARRVSFNNLWSQTHLGNRQDCLQLIVIR